MSALECDDKCEECDEEVFYCCKEHFLLHRPQPKELNHELGPSSSPLACRPFCVSHRLDAGRCLIATRDIQPGELVLEERAVAAGPLHQTGPVCIACFKNAASFDDASPHQCPGCGVPFCSARCASDGAAHSRAECAVLAIAPRPQPNLDRPNEEDPFFQCVLPLRCLLLRESKPEAWRAMQQMMDHLSDKPRDTNWEVVQNNVVRYLLESRKMDGAFTEEDINHVVGALEVNAFEVKPEGGGVGRGVFPLTALMSHSCVANTRYTMFGDGRAEVRANVFIPAGEELTDYYVSPLHGNNYRRGSLRDGWFFLCGCQRCNDPTELGTYLDAFLCQKKHSETTESPIQDCDAGSTTVRNNCGGRLISSDATDFDADFFCETCGRFTPRRDLQRVEDDVSDSLECADKHDASALEDILSAAAPFLADTHYLVLQAKQHLVYAYAQVHLLDAAALARKGDFARQLLGVFDTLAPGRTKERGLMLYEVFSVEYFHLKRRLTALMFSTPESSSSANGDSSSFSWCAAAADRCLELLSECQDCLSHERRGPGAFEGIVAAAARRATGECAELREVLAIMKRQGKGAAVP